MLSSIGIWSYRSIIEENWTHPWKAVLLEGFGSYMGHSLAAQIGTILYPIIVNHVLSYFKCILRLSICGPVGAVKFSIAVVPLRMGPHRGSWKRCKLVPGGMLWIQRHTTVINRVCNRSWCSKDFAIQAEWSKIGVKQAFLEDRRQCIGRCCHLGGVCVYFWGIDPGMAGSQDWPEGTSLIFVPR